MKKDCADCNLCRFNQLYVLNHKATLNRTPSHSSTASSNMAPENENKMHDIDRFLRMVTIGAWLPAFPFLLAHGIMTDMLCPVLGIIPMTFSLIAGIIHLAGRARNRGANIIVDVFIACFLIAILIAGWVFMAEGCRWRCGNQISQAMVGSYGTVPMMVNFCIHTYFVLREICRCFGPKLCPYCHCDLNLKHQQQSRTMSHFSSDSKESYEPVSMVEADGPNKDNGEGPSFNHHDSKQPRPSTDDETARLV